MVQLNYHSHLALIGLVGDPSEERIVAVGRYILDEETNLAEVAFVVREDYRGLGNATHLLRFLADVAREKEFAGITAHVLESNKAMLGTFEKVLGSPNQQSSDYYEVSLCYHF